MRVKPDIISEEMIGAHVFHRDEAGYLIDPDEWNEVVAEHLAAEEGVELHSEHLKIFEFKPCTLIQREQVTGHIKQKQS